MRTHLSDALGYLLWQECRAETKIGRRHADCERLRVETMQNINREHPEYIARKAMWKQYKDLYAGGRAVAAERVGIPGAAAQGAGRGLPGAAEPGVLRELHRLDYRLVRGDADAARAGAAVRRQRRGGEGLLQPAVGRLRPEGNEPERVLPAAVRARRWCAGAVTWWWTFREAGEAAQTRAEEDACGRSRAYLVDYGPDEVINWNYDEAGGLDWVVIRTSCLQQSKVTDAKWERETRWIYYDRENFQIFRKTGEAQADRTGGRRAARAGRAAAGAGIRDEGVGGAVADEQGGARCNWNTSTSRTRFRGR